MHSSKLLPIALSCAFVAQAAHALADERSATRPAQRPQPPTPTAPRQNPAETQSPAVALPVIDTAPAEIPLMGADFQMIRAPSSPEAFGGPRTGKEPTLADHVADYSLKARLDPVAHALEGQETLRWRNRSAQPVRTLYFHLYLNGFTNPDSTWMREKAKYGSFRSGVETKKGEWGYIDVSSVMQGDKAARMNFVHPDGGPSTDRSVLRVELPEAVAPGATVELKIAFHDQLPRVIARTGWFGKYHLVGQWFPKIGVLELPGERGATTARWNCHEFHLNSEFYADWGSYDLEVTAPKGYTVEANGLPVGAPKDTPEGTVHTFRADDVHDAVFTAWDGYAAPIEGSYDGPGSPHVQVRVLFPEEYRASGEVALASTIESLKYFSEQLGPYPYKRVVAVLPPYNAGESGGMEYETFFTTDASPYPAVVRYVTIHEFGHGYFMGLLASNEFEEPFLDEGLNELYDTRMIRAGPTRERSKLEKLLDVHLPVFDPFDLERVPGAARTQADPLAESSWHRYSEGAYNSIYPRTTTAFHDLEQELGTPLFEKAFHLYYARHKFRHPSAGDLKEAFRDAGAHTAVLDRFFDQQVYGTTQVDDSIESIEATQDEPQPGLYLENGKWVEQDEQSIEKLIKEKKEAFKKDHPEAKDDKAKDGKDGKKHAEKGPFQWKSAFKAIRRGLWVPQTILVTFEDGTTERILWPADEKWHRWEFLRPSKIESAQLDPDNSVLMDINKFDDGKAREPNSKATRRWQLELGAWVEALLTIGGSL